jgi:hypothetical protein
MAGKDYAEAVRSGTIAGVLKAALQVEAQAKRIAHGNAVTGRLTGSITYAMRGSRSNPQPPATAGDAIQAPNSEYEAYVGSNVEYAIYNEYGTVNWWTGNPFLRPAIDIVRGKLPVKEAIQAAMAREKGNIQSNRKRFFESRGISL